MGEITNTPFTNNKLSSASARARIGLFWFSQDYSSIIKTEGELEISDEDLLKPKRLDPIGVHAEYDMPKNVPRGRVNYENNVFRIWVGEDCLEEDEKLIHCRTLFLRRISPAILLCTNFPKSIN